MSATYVGSVICCTNMPFEEYSAKETDSALVPATSINFVEYNRAKYH